MKFNIIKFLATYLIRKKISFPDKKIDRFKELWHLKDTLDRLSINCVFDVGANVGQFAQDLRDIGYEGLIISFEPVDRVYKELEKKFRQDKQWVGKNYALGSEDKSQNIIVPRLTVLSSFLDQISDNADSVTQSVNVYKMTSVFKELTNGIENPRCFLKMDTQGYDLEVFRGSLPVLDSIFGLLSEISISAIYKTQPHYLSSLREYESHGFLLKNLSVVNRVDNGSLLEMNVLMFKE